MGISTSVIGGRGRGALTGHAFLGPFTSAHQDGQAATTLSSTQPIVGRAQRQQRSPLFSQGLALCEHQLDWMAILMGILNCHFMWSLVHRGQMALAKNLDQIHMPIVTLRMRWHRWSREGTHGFTPCPDSLRAR